MGHQNRKNRAAADENRMDCRSAAALSCFGGSESAASLAQQILSIDIRVLYCYIATELAQISGRDTNSRDTNSRDRASMSGEGRSLLVIDPKSATPPFEQLRVQVIAAVREGLLVPGTRLPTVRKLADELGLAANTVARAYRELERDEVIETRGRHGSFVSAIGDATHKQAQLAASAYAERMLQLGIEAVEALALVTAALHAHARR
jgi:DNA-binding transcriptional regulator YhcF (GntR family)